MQQSAMLDKPLPELFGCPLIKIMAAKVRFARLLFAGWRMTQPCSGLRHTDPPDYMFDLLAGDPNL